MCVQELVMFVVSDAETRSIVLRRRRLVMTRLVEMKVQRRILSPWPEKGLVWYLHPPYLCMLMVLCASHCSLLDDSLVWSPALPLRADAPPSSPSTIPSSRLNTLLTNSSMILSTEDLLEKLPLMETASSSTEARSSSLPNATLKILLGDL